MIFTACHSPLHPACNICLSWTTLGEGETVVKWSFLDDHKSTALKTNIWN